MVFGVCAGSSGTGRTPRTPARRRSWCSSGRPAGSEPDRVGSWLHGVARNVARKARTAAARRARREHECRSGPKPDGPDPELRPTLDREVARLPGRLPRRGRRVRPRRIDPGRGRRPARLGRGDGREPLGPRPGDPGPPAGPGRVRRPGRRGPRTECGLCRPPDESQTRRRGGRGPEPRPRSLSNHDAPTPRARRPWPPRRRRGRAPRPRRPARVPSRNPAAAGPIRSRKRSREKAIDGRTGDHRRDRLAGRREDGPGGRGRRRGPDPDRDQGHVQQGHDGQELVVVADSATTRSRPRPGTARSVTTRTSGRA